MTFLGVPEGHIPGNSALLTSSKMAKIYYEGFPFHVPDGRIMVCPYTLGSAFAIPVDRMQLYSKTNVRMIVKMDCPCLRSANAEHAWLVSPTSEYTLIAPNSTALQTKRLALVNFSSPPSKRFRPVSDQECREKPMSCSQSTFATPVSRPSTPQTRPSTPTNSVKSNGSSYAFEEYEV
jgi:hypothetical protein